MQPLITAKCQRVPLLPVRDELLLRRYFILNASCLNWSMHLGEVTFFAQSVCCPLPRWLRELPFCLSAFMGQEEGSLSPFSLSASFPSPPAHLLAKEQSPGSCPGPLLSSQHRRCPQSPGHTPPPSQLLAAFRANPAPVAWRRIECRERDRALMTAPHEGSSTPTSLPVISIYF